MRELIDKIITSKFGTALRKFYNSFWYIAAFGLINIVCHWFNFIIPAIAILTVLSIGSFLFCDDLLPIFPFLTMCTYFMTEETMPQKGYYNSTAKLVFVAVCIVLLVASLVFNFVYYKKDRKLFDKAYLTVPLCMLTAALLFGGINSEYYSPMCVLISIGTALCMFIPYSLFVNRIEYKGRETIEYIGLTFAVASAVIGMAVLKEYYVHGFDMSDPKGYLLLGTLVSNSAAEVIAIGIPFTFYMMYVNKRGYLYIPVLVMQVFIIIMTYSRATTLATIPFVAVLFIVTLIKKKEGARAFRIAFGVTVVICALVAGFLWNKIMSLTNTFDAISDDNGRFYLWSLGFEHWKLYPIFGVGNDFLLQTGFGYTSFHCTPMTYLFCCGVVGLAAYLYYRYKTIRLIFSAKLTTERVFIVVAIAITILNALLDQGLFNFVILLCYMPFWAIVEKDVNIVRAKSGLPVLFNPYHKSVPAQAPVKIISENADGADS